MQQQESLYSIGSWFPIFNSLKFTSCPTTGMEKYLSKISANIFFSWKTSSCCEFPSTLPLKPAIQVALKKIHSTPRYLQVSLFQASTRYDYFQRFPNQPGSLGRHRAGYENFFAVLTGASRVGFLMSPARIPWICSEKRSQNGPKIRKSTAIQKSLNFRVTWRLCILGVI